MATTRFCSPFTNRISRGYIVNVPPPTQPRIANGNGAYSGAPALIQDAAYPMSNLHIPNRYTPYVIPAGTATSPILLHFDVAAGNVTAGYFGIHAMRALGLTAGGTGMGSISYSVGYKVSGIYTPTGFTNVASGTIQSGARDFGIAFGQVTARYWEVSLASDFSGGFSIGKIHIGPVTSDMGFLYSPGMKEQLLHETIQGRNGMGHLRVTQTGDDRSLVQMPFRSIKDVDKNKIDSVFGFQSVRDPAVWIDGNDRARQVVLASDAVEWVHVWGPPNIWDTTLDLEVLG